MKSFLILTVFQLIISYTYDSQTNIYKEYSLISSHFKDIANSTWKQFTISDNINNLVKLIPAFIDDDNDIDLLTLDFNSKVYWISNIRGTSKVLQQRFISDTKLIDFVISKPVNTQMSRNNFYVLGLSANREKIFKYNYFHEASNNSIIWKETLFFDLKTDDILKHIIKNSFISALNLYTDSVNRQYLYLSTENYFDNTCYFIKITIISEKIDNIVPISVKSNFKVKIIGTFDMNGDGLIDILYMDEMKNLFCMVNSDPYYFSIKISEVRTVERRGIPRIFIVDSDEDKYPDIIVGNTEDNSFGILFNPGMLYWENIRQNNKNQLWSYISSVNVYEENLYLKKLKDFTVFKINVLSKTNKRINFEVFAIYDNSLYWFVEEELKHAYRSSQKNYLNYKDCMKRSDVTIDREDIFNVTDFNYILEIDINSDSNAEIMLYSDPKLFWVKKYIPFISGVGWNSDFWIYIIVYIYILSSIVGVFEFYKLKKLNDQIAKEKLSKNEFTSDVELYN